MFRELLELLELLAQLELRETWVSLEYRVVQALLDQTAIKEALEVLVHLASRVLPADRVMLAVRVNLDLWDSMDLPVLLVRKASKECLARMEREGSPAEWVMLALPGHWDRLATQVHQDLSECQALLV